MTAYATTRNGFRLLPEYFDRVQQADLAAQVMGALQDAPLFTPSMPRTGKPLSVQMSNFGPLGWVADRSGYR